MDVETKDDFLAPIRAIRAFKNKIGYIDEQSFVDLV